MSLQSKACGPPLIYTLQGGRGAVGKRDVLCIIQDTVVGSAAQYSLPYSVYVVSLLLLTHLLRCCCAHSYVYEPSLRYPCLMWHSIYLRSCAAKPRLSSSRIKFKRMRSIILGAFPFGGHLIVLLPIATIRRDGVGGT